MTLTLRPPGHSLARETLGAVPGARGAVSASGRCWRRGRGERWLLAAGRAARGRRAPLRNTRKDRVRQRRGPAGAGSVHAPTRASASELGRRAQVTPGLGPGSGTYVHVKRLTRGPTGQALGRGPPRTGRLRTFRRGRTRLRPSPVRAGDPREPFDVAAAARSRESQGGGEEEEAGGAAGFPPLGADQVTLRGQVGKGRKLRVDGRGMQISTGSFAWSSGSTKVKQLKNFSSE